MTADLPPVGVALQGVTKRYGSLTAVDDVTVEVPRGSFFALLGPSGCGKTTLLRLVAGFERPEAGRVLIAGEDTTAKPPQRRPTAMVFQNYALFPNMTVGENVGYGLEVKRLKREAVRERVRQALARVDLVGLEGRRVDELSGGQQQRVALARALAVEPAVLLFDEPLSNLDQALREETRRELKTLQAGLGATSLYVTHDQQEAMALADTVAVMRAGRIVEVGPPERLYARPETAFVARFLGGSNLVDDPRLAARLAEEDPPPGHVLAVRPAALEPATAARPNAVPARLLARQFLGTHAEWDLDVEGTRLRLWTEPAREPPEPLLVRAVAHRWVRADGATGPA
ncbi:MAG: ABC transporter ATP-binding protein [Rhodothermales bacterium]|nr:ABC transporter ATP-binding protein [Rhodothermales bacterium]